MVFCGKPSKACLCCRKRRIKCDQKLPACTQCVRVDKICPGYRDQLELCFRDENERTLRKANFMNIPSIVRAKRSLQDGKARVPSPVTRIPTKASGSITEFEFGNLARSNLPITKNLCPLVDKGIAFFLTYYMTVPLERSYNWVDLMPTMSAELFVQSRMLEAVSSVGLAGLSNATRNPNLMAIARKKHFDTINSVIRELGDISNANIEGILKKVVMLVIFELMNTAPRGSHSLSVHANGALSLLKALALRNYEKNKPTTKLQLQFFFAAHIKYFEMDNSPSTQLIEFSELILKNKRTEDATASAVVEIIIRFINLHASIRAKAFTDPVKIVSAVALLDGELERWEANLPIHWNFTVQSRDFSDGSSFDGKCHEYCDVWISRMFNHYRWMRILLNELFLEHLNRITHLTSEHLVQKMKARKIINRMATDICTSISSYFGHTTLVERPTLLPQMSGIPVFLMIWPLFIAGGGTGVPQHLYNWVLGRLDIISKQLGVLSAQTMMERTKIRRQRWIRADMKASRTTCNDTLFPLILGTGCEMQIEMEPLD
ncbi:White-opaque regulator 1-like protein 2 [Botrytis cinerea]